MEAKGQAVRTVLRCRDNPIAGRFSRLTRCFPFIASIALLVPGTAFGQSPAAPARNASTPTTAPAQTQTSHSTGPQSTASSAKSSPPDFSTEPFVILLAKTSVAFQADGSYTSETTLRAKAQSAAGVQQLGVISAPYASATSTMQVVYVKVTKPDGTVVTTPPENVLDMPAAITQQAPFYSDLKVQQVAVKGLAVGDTLEYQFHETSTKPVDPGQFWYDINFGKDAVALDQEAEISVPQGHYLKIQSPDLQPTTQQQNGRTIYTWKTSQLEGTGDQKDQAPATPQEPTIQISTFRNWGEVGAWFNGLAAPQAVPTADVTAKALELTKDAKTDQEKIQLLYDFVSTKYRYIGIDFGIGRYQPHTASEVLSNDYGDCKDKHTLLAALLAAVGIKAYPALISTTTDVDEQIPSPGQFDHVITAVPQGQGYLFLDTTPEVGPFGYLLAALRDKKALVIPDQGPATLVKTPADSPFPSTFSFQSDGTLTDAGEYDGKMQMTMRGDAELVFRLALRQVGESQWNTAVQTISSNLGFGGTVSGASVSKLDDTHSPLEITYAYTRTKVGDWDDKQITAPLPPVDVGAVPDETEKNPTPIKVGSPSEEDMLASIKLPDKADPTLPATVSLHDSFADYDASYSVSGGVLHIERKLTTKAREIPVDQFDAYRKFVKAVTDDESRLIPVYRAANASGRSSNPDAQALFDKAQNELRSGKTGDGTADLRQAVDKDPNFAPAWYTLGALDEMRDPDQASVEFKKAATVDPSDVQIVELAATTLSQQLHRSDDALVIWRGLEAKMPNDLNIHSHIIAILTIQNRYSDLIPELQAASQLNPLNYEILVALGNAYFKTGDPQQAATTLDKVVALDHSAGTLNDVAFALADNDVELDEALQYAQEAVKDLDRQTALIQIDSPTHNDFLSSWQLAHYWDTLGWADFHLKQFAPADRYLNAAWNITQDADIGSHLGQVYEQEGKMHEAAVVYALSVAANPASQTDAATRLKDIHAKAPSTAKDTPNFIALQNMRTFKLPRFYTGSASARFHILFNASGVVSVKFVSGSEELRDKGEAVLKATKFNVPFPAGSSAQIIRSASLNCESVVPQCSVVLIPFDPFSSDD